MIFEFDISKSMHDYNDIFDIMVNMISGGKGMLYIWFPVKHLLPIWN